MPFADTVIVQPSAPPTRSFFPACGRPAFFNFWNAASDFVGSIVSTMFKGLSDMVYTQLQAPECRFTIRNGRDVPLALTGR